MNRELKIFLWLVAGFLVAYFIPIEAARLQSAVLESIRLVQWYAREHVLLCLVPAFFIAGAIGVFVSQNAVMKYFGPKANKLLSYGVASVSGSVLAVCSCTVLPLFGGITMRGAGLGPAVAFLYSGPAINVLAIVLSASVLGARIGIARAVGAVLFSLVIGGLMHLIFRKEERARAEQADDLYMEPDDRPPRPLWQNALFFFAMVAVLVFANWTRPEDPQGRVGTVFLAVFQAKWWLTSGFGLVVAAVLWKVMGLPPGRVLGAVAATAITAVLVPGHPVVAFTVGFAALAGLMFRSTDEMAEWRAQTWSFAKQIAPLLLLGVLAAGFFLGGPESEDAGIVPNRWITLLVGDDSGPAYAALGGAGQAPSWVQALWPVWTNFFASVVGALMYFATLTEVPIVRGLMDSGMSQGPALALLLAGPALSLPNMLVIHSILGLKKTLAFVALVVVTATLSGLIFGAFFA